MVIFGLIFGLMTMTTHFIIVILQLVERKIPIIGWVAYILNMVLIPLRAILAVLTDKFHPEGQMRAKILALTTNVSEEDAEEIINIHNENNKDDNSEDGMSDLSKSFKYLNRNKVSVTNDEVDEMRRLGFTHSGIITRVGTEQVNPFSDEYPKAYIEFDDDFKRISVKYDNQETTYRYIFDNVINGMVVYGEGSVRYMELSEEPFLYMDADNDIEIALSIAKI